MRRPAVEPPGLFGVWEAGKSLDHFTWTERHFPTVTRKRCSAVEPLLLATFRMTSWPPASFAAGVPRSSLFSGRIQAGPETNVQVSVSRCQNAAL